MLKRPRSLLQQPQSHMAQSHDLSKFDILSYTWRGARYQLSVRIGKKNWAMFMYASLWST